MNIESPHSSDWRRMSDLMSMYRDFPLGAVDAYVIALAERLNTDLIVTFDHRHFRAVRPRHVDAFRILPDCGLTR
jgi:predicted nucleic acid-binding protein